ncbi:MAG: hypothetical protein K8T90_22175 [Planctomycetes bacterium]|nr:hypothetical protein [Planctomycetota bacterium]
MLEFVDGNTAVLRAAIDAGCSFFAGYPITPATSIRLEAVREMPARGGVVIQGGDEIDAYGCLQVGEPQRGPGKREGRTSASRSHSDRAGGCGDTTEGRVSKARGVLRSPGCGSSSLTTSATSGTPWTWSCDTRGTRQAWRRAPSRP